MKDATISSPIGELFLRVIDTEAICLWNVEEFTWNDRQFRGVYAYLEPNEKKCWQVLEICADRRSLTHGTWARVYSALQKEGALQDMLADCAEHWLCTEEAITLLRQTLIQQKQYLKREITILKNALILAKMRGTNGPASNRWQERLASKTKALSEIQAEIRTFTQNLAKQDPVPPAGQALKSLFG